MQLYSRGLIPVPTCTEEPDNRVKRPNRSRPDTAVGGDSASFGTDIDDFNVTRATVNPQLVDSARIELVRGPQGTFFGRNASAGVISLAPVALNSRTCRGPDASALDATVAGR